MEGNDIGRVTLCGLVPTISITYVEMNVIFPHKQMNTFLTGTYNLQIEEPCKCWSRIIFFLEERVSIKFLGMYLDEDLTWEDHIDNL